MMPPREVLLFVKRRSNSRLRSVIEVGSGDVLDCSYGAEKLMNVLGRDALRSKLAVNSRHTCINVLDAR
jgi:hypothetical protein